MTHVDASLYPDIHEMGGLVSAMASTAVRKGLDLGKVYSENRSGSGDFETARVCSSRGVVTIELGEQSRAFFLTVQGEGFTWVEGATDDLDALVTAVTAWRAGVLVDEFAAKFPFVAVGRLAKAHERGDPTSAQWQWLLSADEFVDERPLVEAAYAHHQVRTLFPNLSHGTLRLSWGSGRQGAREIHVSPDAGGVYRLGGSAFPEVLIEGSLREVIAAVADLLARA